MATQNGVQDEDLAGLSDEERAALEADEGDDVNALKEIADDGDGDDDGNDDPDNGDSGDDANDQVNADDNHSDDSGEQNPDGDDANSDEAEENEFVPTYHVDPVENFDAKIQQLAEQKKSLREQLNNGDIDLDAYEEQKDAIVANENALREQNLKAQIAAEQSQQNAQARWQWEQERFFGDKTNTIYQDKYVMAMLDAAVKDLAQAPDNAQRSANWFLQEADRIVRDRIGQPRNANVQADKQNAQPNRKPDLSKIPKSLADLPSAELPDTGSEEFAHLDKLDGIKLEQAIVKMTPEQQARYLGLNE